MSRKAEDIVRDGKSTQFKKGVVTNPKGRPPGIPNTATRLQRFLSIVQKHKNPVTAADENLTVAEIMDLEQIKKALNGDTAAWEKILNRLEGNTANKTEITGPEGGAIEAKIEWIIRRPATEDGS
jgi:hypothetical protein